MRMIALPVTCLLALAACGGSPAAPPPAASESEQPAQELESKPAPEPSGPLADMLDNPLAGMLMDKLDEPGRYDPPEQSPEFDAATPHLRVLELAGSVGEVELVDPLAFAGGGGSSIQTKTLLDRLEALSEDEAVTGLVLRVGELSLDLARARELRAGLIAFRGEGEGARELHCHAEGLGNMSYYLLSACDDLALVPVGNLSLPGPAATPIHLKGLLDKLGVEAQMLHVGAFKGAAEPLTRDAPSPEMLETLAAIVDHSYATMVSGISQARGKPELTVQGWIDTAMFDATNAAEAGLIDAVEPWEPYLARVVGERGWKELKLETPPWSDPKALARFIGLDFAPAASEPHVALIYAVGNIIDGKGGGALGARAEIASGQLVPVLDRLAADEDVSSVVLRIDSGGGSARASEQIWHALERLKARKPVVVSMAGVAASGGYYIAAGASRIFADADTLTGSIGVVGGKIVIGPALERWGVRSYAVTKGERALLWSPMQAWNEAERDAVQANMEQTYEVFLARVAAGRGMQRDAVHEIAQGRVWTGDAAKEHGLVDELGGLEAALAEAYRLAKLEPGGEGVGALEVYPDEPTLRDLLGSFEQVVAMRAGVDTQLLPPSFTALVDTLAHSVGPQGQGWILSLRRALGTFVQLSHTQLWAVEWIEPPR